MRRLCVSAAAALAAVLALAPPVPDASAFDHGDAPLARADGQLDLCDLYVFTSPEDPERTILVLTASPFAGQVGSEAFATKASYNLNIDVNGDLVEDDVHTFAFAAPGADGRQTVTASHRGRGGKTKAKGTTGAAFTFPNGTRVQCGVFDDPAFVDLRGIRAGNVFAQGTSRNFFAGGNALGIVVDVANGEIGPNQGLRVWATATRGKAQVDRVARPCLASLLLVPGRRDAFNAAKLKTDVTVFKQDVVQRLVTLRSGNYTGVDDLARQLLPDVLPFTLGSTAGYLAGNGRRLDEDVVDAQLALFTANAVTTDHVANDSTFGTVFPFLAPANP